MVSTRTILAVKDTSLALRSYISGEIHILSGNMIVGRDTDCDIRLSSPQISRHHARISIVDDTMLIEDLESTNGTFVNGEEVTEGTRIHLGDRISFDEISFRVTFVKLEPVRRNIDSEVKVGSESSFSKTIRGRFFYKNNKESSDNKDAQ